MFHDAVKIFSAMYPSETVRRIQRDPVPTSNERVVSEGYMAENIAPGKDQGRKTASRLEAAPTVELIRTSR